MKKIYINGSSCHEVVEQYCFDVILFMYSTGISFM